MLDCVGFSVAMGNAPNSMTASVDYIAPTIEDDGLATVINEVVIPGLS
jgi:hydroxymethylpyrimidine pyrophosphatase-like HAD family hydrolase